MQRLSSDRGAVAVMTALLLVPLLVCAGFVIDIGASYVQWRQLQNAADAAALAIAQYCGNGNCSPDHNQKTADFFTSANAGRAATAKVDPVRDNNTVTVTTKATVNYEFAPVIGTSNNTVTASATASWGSPTGGPSVLPLTISLCSFRFQTGGGLPTGSTAVTIKTTRNDGSECNGRPGHNDVPGGFGWVDVDPGGGCIVTSIITGHLSSKTGAPPSCPDSLINAQIGNTVLLPIFWDMARDKNDKIEGGTNASYIIYAYAAFHLTNFYSKGNDSSITGYFTKFVDLSGAFTHDTGSPNTDRLDTGAQVVTLTA